MRNEKFLRDFDWNLLMTFLVIAEEGGITAAARRLFRTQPSVSNALIRLERLVGHRLIDRRPGIFALTEAGRRLHERALQTCRSVEAVGDMLGPDAKLTGRVSYHIASHIHCPPVDGALAQLHAEEPEVTFAAVVSPSEDIVTGVRAGTINLGFAVLNAEAPGLSCRHLNDNEMGFFCGPPHPLFGRTGLTIEDLDGHDYVSFESDQLSAGLESVARLGLAGRFRDRLAATSPNEEELTRFIEAGIGFGPLVVPMAADHLAAGRLWRLPPYENLPRVRNFLVTNPKTALSASEQRFIALIEERLRGE